jgi:hypothetical protein
VQGFTAAELASVALLWLGLPAVFVVDPASDGLPEAGWFAVGVEFEQSGLAAFL